MGSCVSHDGDVERLFDFRKLSTEDLELEIPEKAQNRKPTDRPWLYFFIAAYILLIPFLIYTLSHTELRQLSSGSDNCGNFCGYKNKKYDEWSCTGKDYTDQKYEYNPRTIAVLGYYILEKVCVSSCPNNSYAISHVCPSDAGNPRTSFIATLGEIERDLSNGWWAILLSAIISCALSFGALLLFRYNVEMVVWFIISGSLAAFSIFAGILWYCFLHFSSESDDQSYYNKDRVATKFLSLAICFSIAAFALVLVTCCMVKRIKLTIALLKEASNIIFEIPSVILLPIYTATLLTLMIFGFVLLTFLMAMAGKLTEIVPIYLTYSYDTAMIIAMVFNSALFLWLIQFVMDCQYFVLAGAVSSWFFTRNKQQLIAPVWTSFNNLIRFHLGTVALGSLILIIVNYLKAVLRKMSQNHRTRWLVECCMNEIEYIIRLLSNNAYIECALHGQPFCESGKRAAKLLFSNAFNVVAVNSIGDYILAVAMLLLILLSSFAGILLAKAIDAENYWTVAIVCIIIATCMGLVFFSIMKTAIDSIFICFCEDTALNDGMARPYFMSKSLMKFIEDSKALETIDH